MITFNNTGISSNPTKSGRLLVYTDIIRNGETYNWAFYASIPNGMGLTNYMTANADIWEQDIIRKEALWAISPHTEQITLPGQGTITVDIPKSRIVHPDVPDYEEMISDPSLDIKSIKRLLTLLTNMILTGGTATQQQINDLAVVNDNFVPKDKSYVTGDLFSYEGKLYEVLQNHTSAAEWLPTTATSLYKVKTPPGVISAWVQPLGAHDAYVKWSKVTHNGITWENMIDANVFEPGAVGSESLWINISSTTTTTTVVAGTTTTTTAGILPWVQPSGAGDAYPLNAIVTHNGFIWRSDYAANVWEPSIFGWTKI